MNIEENKKLWAKIVAKAWCDEAFKAELLNNPEQVLKAEGAEIPEGWSDDVEPEDSMEYRFKQDIHIAQIPALTAEQAQRLQKTWRESSIGAMEHSRGWSRLRRNPR